MNNYLIVATTATNRTHIHTEVLPDWIKWIKNIQNYKIKWFINVDVLSTHQHTYENVCDNIKKLFGKDFDRIFNVEFISHTQKKGNFLWACKRLSSEIINFVDNIVNKSNTKPNISDIDSKIKIMWLEDDWKMNPSAQTININDVVNLYSIKNSHVNFSYIRNNYIWALAPCIISYDLWKSLYNETWKQHQILENNNNPEHVVGLKYIEKFGDPTLMTNITVINKKINNDFFDQPYINRTNSFYTYHNDTFNIFTDNKYIKKENMKNFDKENKENKPIFVRITSSLCNDIGRQDVSKQDIKSK